MGNQPYSELWRRAHNLAAEFQSLFGLAETLEEAKNAEEFITKAKKEIADLQYSSASLKTEIVSLRKTIDNLGTEYNDRKARLSADYNGYLTELDKRKSEITGSIDREFNAKAAVQAKLLADTDKKIVDAQTTLAGLEKKIAEQQTLLSTTQAKVNEIRKTLEELHG